ncbi:DMT family transporter [Microtetraspora niveoalba]|uniref:DMT family transporter n=1 Tax=Microtetraspora niveoalba TaxID=46175 RepID=UPI00082CDDA3|nr:EamA family transporter [Microtetraspora niveoalba]
MTPRSGSLTVVAAAVLWGTAGTVGALAPAGSVPLAAARLVIGGAVLAAVAARAARATRVGRVGPAAGQATPSVPGRAARRVPRTLLAAGGLAVAAYQLCFFAAVARTGVAIGTVVAIGSGPVFTGLLSWLLDRTRPSGRWAVATSAAIAGCAVLTTGGGAGGADAGGIALALVGGLLYAFYAVTAARAIGAGMGSDTVMGVLFGAAGLIMLPVLVAGGTGWLAEPRGLLAALYLGCAATALAYVLYGRGLRTTPVATAATLALAEPAVAAILGLVVLREHLSALSWGGLVLLAASLVVVALPGRKPAPRDASIGETPGRAGPDPAPRVPATAPDPTT